MLCVHIRIASMARILIIRLPWLKSVSVPKKLFQYLKKTFLFWDILVKMYVLCTHRGVANEYTQHTNISKSHPAS